MHVSECRNWAINGLLFADPVDEVRRPTLSQSYNSCGSINVHRPPALATDFSITAIFGTDNCVPVYESPVAVIRDQPLFINFVLDCTLPVRRSTFDCRALHCPSLCVMQVLGQFRRELKKRFSCSAETFRGQRTRAISLTHSRYINSHLNK